jgi:eukaryotic-like serine/threonine-protein kinase
MAAGTPVYMSPEQIGGDGEIGPRSDIYALGHIAYALLAGEPYWSEESKRDEALYPLLAKMLEGVIEPPSARVLRRGGRSLPPAFDAWFLKATARSPHKRFERTTSAVAALAEALSVRLPRAPLSPIDPVAEQILCDGDGQTALSTELSATFPTSRDAAPPSVEPASAGQLPTVPLESPLPLIRRRFTDGEGEVPPTIPLNSSLPLIIGALMVLILAGASVAMVRAQRAWEPGALSAQDAVATQQTSSAPTPPSTQPSVRRSVPMPSPSTSATTPGRPRTPPKGTSSAVNPTAVSSEGSKNQQADLPKQK